MGREWEILAAKWPGSVSGDALTRIELVSCRQVDSQPSKQEKFMFRTTLEKAPPPPPTGRYSRVSCWYARATSELRRRRRVVTTIGIPRWHSHPVQSWLRSESGAWMVLVSPLVGTEALEWGEQEGGGAAEWRWIVSAGGDNLRSRAPQTNKGACLRSNENMSASFTFYFASLANSVCALLK